MSKPYSGIILAGMLLAASTLAGCSGSSDDTASGDEAKSATQTQTAAPANQPAANPHTAAAAANPPAANANGLPTGGKVIKAMHAGGYTYMQVENDGKQFWIASTMLNVRSDDRVSWASAAVMKDFKSTTLRRTFDEILFVSNATVDQ
jgi:hypothetical protein